VDPKRGDRPGRGARGGDGGRLHESGLGRLRRDPDAPLDRGSVRAARDRRGGPDRFRHRDLDDRSRQGSLHRLLRCGAAWRAAVRRRGDGHRIGCIRPEHGTPARRGSAAAARRARSADRRLQSPALHRGAGAVDRLRRPLRRAGRGPGHRRGPLQGDQRRVRPRGR
jgi:hypothetical protein